MFGKKTKHLFTQKNENLFGSENFFNSAVNSIL